MEREVERKGGRFCDIVIFVVMPSWESGVRVKSTTTLLNLNVRRGFCSCNAETAVPGPIC